MYVCLNRLRIAFVLTSLLQIEEVKAVTQILDQEEEIAMKEFSKFEEKLKQQKGPDAIASTVGKGSLDTLRNVTT